MSHNSKRAVIKLSLAASALTISSGAWAQSDDLSNLPGDLQSAPSPTDYSETAVSADGVETITRTRRIERAAPAHSGYEEEREYVYDYAPVSYAPAASVFEREQWIEECERRTDGYGEEEKGGIIGSLLGAITGGLIGNRVAGSGERLGGTLIGAGVGGLGGFLLGNLIGGGKKNDRYDCEAALDSYLSQHASGPVRVARRSIPAPGPAYHAYPAYPAYGYAPAYNYAPPQQIVYVPVRYEQQQRVVVRETVREETYQVPGATRIIERPAPSPKLIKQPRRVVPAPSPKLIKD